MGRLIILSGPSCVGKGPLAAGLERMCPEVAGRMGRAVLYNSRRPRPGEQDGVAYHFRRAQEIEAMEGREGFVVFRVRNDIQAVDMGELAGQVRERDVLADLNPFLAQEVLSHRACEGLERLEVFLSPLCREEVLFLRERGVDVRGFVTELMRRKQIRRASQWKANLSEQDKQDLELRAGSAYDEMLEAWRFDWVLANHDGEDSENWTMEWPVGDAWATVRAFAELLETGATARGERWEAGVMGED